MKYDFDKIIERKNTNSIKYDGAASRGMPEGLLPLWVADMDFQTAPCIIRALAEKSNHGIFGYSEIDDSFINVLQNWFARRFNWEIKSDWLVQTPGVVHAIYMAVRAFTEPGDSVMIQPPVYYPFRSAIEQTGRRLTINPLVLKDGRYNMNMDDFEAKIITDKVKLFILCSPHNPVGRVWSSDELTELGNICSRHNVLVVSDEIHADFIYPKHRHQVFANLKPEFQKISVTCTSPSKTFNLAGLQLSNIFIPDKELRKKFRKECNQSGTGLINIMGIVSCKAAYSDGEDWLSELLVYLAENLALLRDHLSAFPQVKLVEPEGTYLAWLDCRGTKLEAKELNELIINNAGLWLDDGLIFGDEGSGFQRINYACPRSILKQGMEKLIDALSRRQ